MTVSAVQRYQREHKNGRANDQDFSHMFFDLKGLGGLRHRWLCSREGRRTAVSALPVSEERSP